MAHVLSVNVGDALPTEHSDVGVTGIDKRPVTGEVPVRAPATMGPDGAGLAGDHVCDSRHHGGPDQAVYAYAREDLADWSVLLDRPLRPGMFGENLTTDGLDVTGALIGERWLVGNRLTLEVARPRIPCRTFAGWLCEQGWVKRFTQQARPGAYLRVVEPGPVAAGMTISQVYRPAHDVTIGLSFRALTLEPELLPRLLAADALPAKLRERARRAAEVAAQ